MKLEELVPPLELCKLIPKGEFEDSALMWVEDVHPTLTPFVEPRRYVILEDEEIPAPTLEEIMAKLPPLQEVFRDEFDNDETLWTTDWGNYSKNATETALKSWFYQKGIGYEK